jgi:hypothetical protein
MTPTLFGRWQTRTLLLLTFGVLFTLPFMLFYGLTPALLLLLILVLGYGWDIVYMVIQGGRWDRDWPPAYQLFAGVWEGVFVFVLSFFLGRVFPIFAVPLPIFILQYGVIWLVTFLASQSLLRIIFPNWRYRGGQWLF